VARHKFQWILALDRPDFRRTEDTALLQSLDVIDRSPKRIIRAEDDLRNRDHLPQRRHRRGVRCLGGIVVKLCRFGEKTPGKLRRVLRSLRQVHQPLDQKRHRATRVRKDDADIRVLQRSPAENGARDRT
jgi:hypothetical protein